MEFSIFVGFPEKDTLGKTTKYSTEPSNNSLPIPVLEIEIAKVSEEVKVNLLEKLQEFFDQDFYCEVLPDGDVMFQIPLVKNLIGESKNKIIPIPLVYLYGRDSPLKNILLTVRLRTAADVLRVFDVMQGILRQFVTHLEQHLVDYRNAGISFNDHDQDRRLLLDDKSRMWVGFFTPSISIMTNHYSSFADPSEILHDIQLFILMSFAHSERHVWPRIENMFANDGSAQSRKVLQVLKELAEQGALSFSEVNYENALIIDSVHYGRRAFRDFFVVTTCDAEKLNQLYLKTFIQLDKTEEKALTLNGPRL